MQLHISTKVNPAMDDRFTRPRASQNGRTNRRSQVCHGLSNLESPGNFGEFDGVKIALIPEDDTPLLNDVLYLLSAKVHHTRGTFTITGYATTPFGASGPRWCQSIRITGKIHATVLYMGDIVVGAPEEVSV